MALENGFQLERGVKADTMPKAAHGKERGVSVSFWRFLAAISGIQGPISIYLAAFTATGCFPSNRGD